MIAALPLDHEWLESDARGGFASGTVAGYRTRRYHALLLAPRRPPGDRVVLVNGFEAWVDARTTFPVSVAGLGHVSEIADGDPPHAPRGCPFQAWSTGELIRALARTARPSEMRRPA